jgi:hypothetical protein
MDCPLCNYIVSTSIWREAISTTAMEGQRPRYEIRDEVTEWLHGSGACKKLLEQNR